jgi:hypothetical protein
MTARKKRNTKNTNGIDSFIVIMVLAVFCANIWAGWRILKIADILEIPIIGPVHNGPFQLAGLLLANSIIICILSITRGK